VPPPIPEAYGRALARVGSATLACLEAQEAALRRLHPPLIASLRERLAPLRDHLAEALVGYRGERPPAELEPFHDQLVEGATSALAAVSHFVEPSPPERLAAGVLASMRDHARAQEILYPLRLALPPLGAYYVEAALREPGAELDASRSDSGQLGIHLTREEEAGGRGGFALYVPERYHADRPWPLVVALHGGHGRGRDFLWTWLREARGRGFLLLAPTSRGDTWSLDAPDRDATALRQMLDVVCARWNVDRGSVLLTGLSDGATFTLLAGLAEHAPYTALAPVSGVLHPASFARGDLPRARGRRIYLVHGALDWMFPVSLARMARDQLAEAGAELVYRELDDLSHTYPREENARILAWFDSRLALLPRP